MKRLNHWMMVAPLRVRELKQRGRCFFIASLSCRTFTGAWIETSSQVFKVLCHLSHLYGCVNWNINETWPSFSLLPSHLYGCVNWNNTTQCLHPCRYVAPLRVRELKLTILSLSKTKTASHLYGCVNWNSYQQEPPFDLVVAPLRVRELKPVL